MKYYKSTIDLTYRYSVVSSTILVVWVVLESEEMFCVQLTFTGLRVRPTSHYKDVNYSEK